ncbi:HAD-IIA family hydrolase [Morganella morganii]|uniref:HAD-IIA family hydrolase n=1 Tax=Morganella morganii TaxID=582 RepID=UPI001BDB7A4B|nr:HAD-IIA family hydrolase [Morganella morganii]MBT0444348.1 HAD-IIA family hydrolase [Morganella morganii subsp. morganii]HEO9720290.1 HAD-IIA family hydrolase [Morganella morganii subsp. morganii]
MIGVILAAGVGSRLRPMTNNKPKCLVTTAGKPILQYQLDAYKNAGITDIIIIVGYEGDAIRNYCKYIKDLNIKIIENSEYEDSNNMYSLYLARDFIKGKPFILNNADLAVENNLILDMVSSSEKDIVAVDFSTYNEESMKVTCNDEGMIINISKQINKNETLGCSIDFYKFSDISSDIFFEELERIIVKEKNKKDWTEIAMQRLFQSQTLKFKPFNIKKTAWVEIDNYADLALSDKIFSQLKKKITDYTGYCFDLDGTIYVGNRLIPHVIESIKYLKDNNKIVKFISNNSSKSNNEYLSKLNALGIDCTIDDIKLSTDSVISYLKDRKINKVYVLGTKSLQKQIIDAGFEFCSHSPEFIVVGYDNELTYSKLKTTCRLINNNIDYIATHCDIFCPSEDGPIPDIGTIILTLEKTTGVKPYKIFGKPNSDLIDLILKENKLKNTDMLMIGDRLYTDILMASNANVDSVLVLSGDTQREELEGSEIKPTYILDYFSVI